MHHPIDDDVTSDSDYQSLLTGTAKSIKLNAMMFPSVGINIAMNSHAATRFAVDLERIANEYKRDSSG